MTPALLLDCFGESYRVVGGVVECRVVADYDGHSGHVDLIVVNLGCGAEPDRISHNQTVLPCHLSNGFYPHLVIGQNIHLSLFYLWFWRGIYVSSTFPK